ncbi:MAG: (2Fe-2S) ferredoxin domain-containing protein [Acidobacteriota bacterium]|nr:(2Fe-2S) ferredoxin domain-containing protein [Acidobacteriota bacterium]MDH3786453.1 (2Fe-2S) ferredoxin domain-containing protein [Acidobacteriota bacterium]
MPPFERHVFVCVNERAADNPKGCCVRSGGREVHAKLKRLAFEAGLKGKVRINSAGCLSTCEDGVTIVVYPEAVWYGHVTPVDVEEILNDHLIGGTPVERLRIQHATPAKPGADG